MMLLERIVQNLRTHRIATPTAMSCAYGAGLIALAAVAGCARPSTLYSTQATTADSLARDLIRREQFIPVASIPQNTLSVAPLAVVSTDTTYAPLGFGVASLLVHDLAQSSRLVLVERIRLDAVLRELSLAQSGRVDTLTAPKVGKLVGARQLVVGSIVIEPRGNLRVQSYLANTVTGGVSAPLTGNGQLAQVLDAEKSLVFRLFEALRVTLTPAERRAVEQPATRSLQAFLAFSRGSRDEAFKNFGAASTHYAEAVRLDPGFAQAGERLSILQTTLPGSANNAAAAEQLGRASAMTMNFVNRSAPVIIGTGVDIPAAALQQLFYFTIVVRTP